VSADEAPGARVPALLLLHRFEEDRFVKAAAVALVVGQRQEPRPRHVRCGHQGVEHFYHIGQPHRAGRRRGVTGLMGFFDELAQQCCLVSCVIQRYDRW